MDDEKWLIDLMARAADIQTSMIEFGKAIAEIADAIQKAIAEFEIRLSPEERALFDFEKDVK